MLRNCYVWCRQHEILLEEGACLMSVDSDNTSEVYVKLPKWLMYTILLVFVAVCASTIYKDLRVKTVVDVSEHERLTMVESRLSEIRLTVEATNRRLDDPKWDEVWRSKVNDGERRLEVLEKGFQETSHKVFAATADSEVRLKMLMRDIEEATDSMGSTVSMAVSHALSQVDLALETLLRQVAEAEARVEASVGNQERMDKELRMKFNTSLLVLDRLVAAFRQFSRSMRAGGRVGDLVVLDKAVELTMPKKAPVQIDETAETSSTKLVESERAGDVGIVRVIPED